MTSKRRSSKKSKLPVGDLVPVIGRGELIEMFVRKSSSKDPEGQFDRSSADEGLMWIWRNQGHHKAVDFHLVGIELGTRCPARSLWKKYVADASSFVVLLQNLNNEDAMDYLYSYIFKDDVDFILDQNDTDKTILILIDHSSEEEFDSAGPPHPTFQAWIDQLEKAHRVAHFPVCLEAGRGMEPALDWLTDHLSPSDALQEVKKSRSALHWLAEVGKKVLTFGAASKKATAA